MQLKKEENFARFCGLTLHVGLTAMFVVVFSCVENAVVGFTLESTVRSYDWVYCAGVSGQKRFTSKQDQQIDFPYSS